MSGYLYDETAECCVSASVSVCFVTDIWVIRISVSLVIGVPLLLF